MLVTARRFATLALLTFLIVPGCSTPQRVPTSPDATQLQGLWDMDLSPAQDRSYLKDLVIVPVAIFSRYQAEGLPFFDIGQDRVNHKIAGDRLLGDELDGNGLVCRNFHR